MPKVLLTVPVYNEEDKLENSIIQIREYMKNNFHYPCIIIIADNGSIDKTSEIARSLEKKFKNVKYLYIPTRGRGCALKISWCKYKADIYAYMDVDLSKELKHLPKLVEAIIKGYDISKGTRLFKSSKVKRSLHRKIISKAYNILLKIAFRNKFSDAQCGFKAVSKKVVKELLPKIKDGGWFFDTELLLKAEKENYKIKEIPVTWIENKKSKVKLIETSLAYLKGIFRLKKELKNFEYL